MKDPYYTKWTNYTAPKWYHPYNGSDARAEYMYRRRVNSVLAPRTEIMLEYVEVRRFWVYLALFGLS